MTHSKTLMGPRSVYKGLEICTRNEMPGDRRKSCDFSSDCPTPIIDTLAALAGVHPLELVDCLDVLPNRCRRH